MPFQLCRCTVANRSRRYLTRAVLAVVLLALSSTRLMAVEFETFYDLGDLSDGQSKSIHWSPAHWNLTKLRSLELSVTFDEAPFSGTRLSVSVNGHRLLPYYAFGGDTRYDNVKGKPGMRPPLAAIEGRWLIPISLLKKEGLTEFKFQATKALPNPVLDRIGPKPSMRIKSVTIGDADGAILPQFANSIYFDFDVWAQGYDWGPDAARRHHFDLALLGAINGKGMPCISAPLEGNEASLWSVKRACEDNALRWGYGHQEFYTIWDFCGNPNLWAKFVDVDKNPTTEAKFHGQTIFDYVQSREKSARGADLMLYDVEKYRRSLEPSIKALAPYTDFYNFKCEQHGPNGQGFGFDGMKWADKGMDGKLWASNYYEAAKAAHDLVRKYNPENGRIQEINHWLPGVRHFLFDTALQRHQPVSDMIDVLMTHFTMTVPYDLDSQGKIVPGETFEKQYPGGRFNFPRNDWPKYLANNGFKPVGVNGYPETAIDFNRYRLGRSEKDLKVDPKTHRWGNGQPFDFRAGLRGDELMYNSENGVYLGYSAPAAHQFLHGFFSYSLLPTAATEPRDLKLTERRSLTETRDMPVNLYGEWIEGVGHTKRLRTIDPLYGDLFGWTGDEHCTTGDYIRLPGIKDPHHRLPPHDAYGLIRRTCYAFVTTGTVVPAYQGKDHSEDLIVKTLTQVFDGQRYLGIYAANFDKAAHVLDVVLPVPLAAKTEGLVFDDRAADWTMAKKLPLGPGKEIPYRTEVPGVSAWLVLIPMPAAGLSESLDLLPPPTSLDPIMDGLVTDEKPVLRWKTDRKAAKQYEVELAHEALFRSVDRIELAKSSEPSLTVQKKLAEKSRYFWRVRSLDDQDRGGEWSPPQSLVYRWPEYSKVYPPQTTPTAKPAETPKEKPAPWQLKSDEQHLESTPNLAWQGEIYGTGGRMHSPSRAVDAQAFSGWTNGTDESNSQFTLPAEWAVIWPKSTEFRRVRILWNEELLPKEFVLQISDNGKNWKDLKKGTSSELFTDLRLKQPVESRYLRVLIIKSNQPNRSVGIRELLVTND